MNKKSLIFLFSFLFLNFFVKTTFTFIKLKKEYYMNYTIYTLGAFVFIGFILEKFNKRFSDLKENLNEYKKYNNFIIGKNLLFCSRAGSFRIFGMSFYPFSLNSLLKNKN
jgi:hypothetical protein